MLRTLVLTILLTFSANSAFALTAKDVVTKGKVIASAIDGKYGGDMKMVIIYKDNLYACRANFGNLERKRIRCALVTEDELK